MVAASVAAASIVAKVTRDRIMRRLDRRYPAFGFSQNKGYGTPEHWVALEPHGPSAVHRLVSRGSGKRPCRVSGAPTSVRRESMPMLRWKTTSNASKRNASWSCTGSTATCSRCSAS